MNTLVSSGCSSIQSYIVINIDIDQYQKSNRDKIFCNIAQPYEPLRSPRSRPDLVWGRGGERVDDLTSPFSSGGILEYSVVQIWSPSCSTRRLGCFPNSSTHSCLESEDTRRGRHHTLTPRWEGLSLTLFTCYCKYVIIFLVIILLVTLQMSLNISY
jgi:hypothetical protein